MALVVLSVMSVWARRRAIVLEAAQGCGSFVSSCFFSDFSLNSSVPGLFCGGRRELPGSSGALRDGFSEPREASGAAHSSFLRLPETSGAPRGSFLVFPGTPGAARGNFLAVPEAPGAPHGGFLEPPEASGAPHGSFLVLTGSARAADGGLLSSFPLRFPHGEGRELPNQLAGRKGKGERQC